MRFVRSLMTLILMLALTGLALAQAPQGGGGQRGGGEPGARGGGRGGRGGGGGPALTLTTMAWPDGGEIPAKYTQTPGQPGVSPAFTWTNTPMGTMSFVLLMHDPDVALGGTNAPDDVLHWLA